jgi:pyrimidine operon attenuation protein/uracil phosphoribosyltransferase
MKDSNTLILNHDEIHQKITRMAWQILENNHKATQIILIGVEKKGTAVAQLIANVLESIASMPVRLGKVWVDKNNPNAENVEFQCEAEVSGSHVVLVDDVLNSGKTLMYATLPILERSPVQLQTAVLANRDHANFPIKADFVGISLSTTLQEHINFTRNEAGEMSVFLD